MEIGDDSQLHNANILIIGAGPAGTSAAIWAAKFGLSVTIIESLKFPRYRPGETLHPGVETLFDQLGVKEDIKAAKYIRHKGICTRWSSQTHDHDHADGYKNENENNNNNNENNHWNLIPFGEDENGPWLGYQIWRATLDGILLKRAHECGVFILQPCQSLDVILDNSKRVIGVKTSFGNFLADFVIDATGSTHWLARRLRLVIEKNSPALFAYYGYAEGECPSRDEAPAILLVPEGWIWTARIQKNLYQWTRLYLNSGDDNRVIIPHDWLPDEFKGLKPVESVRGADVTWRRVVQPSGPGYFIVGDAAAVLDPASSHGVLKGIMSGMQAAHAVIRIVRDHFPSEITSKNYNDWMNDWFLHDIKKLHEFYSHHYSLKWL